MSHKKQPKTVKIFGNVYTKKKPNNDTGVYTKKKPNNDTGVNN
jgi:hypothetical protein